MGTITTSPNDHPTITYTVDGVNRSMSSGLHGTGWTLGQQIEISYNPSNPAQASTNGERLATVIFMSVGLPVAVAGLVLLIHAVVRFFIWRAVIAHGHREQATLTDVRQRLVNVITTYSTTFSCTWKSPDKVVHSFRSAPIRLDRRISLTDLPFTTLPVYVDLDHPTRYYVDDTEVRQYFASHR